MARWTFWRQQEEGNKSCITQRIRQEKDTK